MNKLIPRGIITPIITPFTNVGEVNYPVLEQMVEMLLENGIHGVFPLGTTGEFYAFSNQQYQEIIRSVVRCVNGRVPVYAGANHITTAGTDELVKLAEAAGADAVSVLTPVFISQTQQELYTFFETLALRNPGVSIVMYNNRPKTNITIEPETVARLAQVDNIVGVKDSTGDMTNTMEYIRLCRSVKDFSVLVGRDTLIYPGLCCGAAGAISSCSNVAPALTVGIYEDYQQGRLTSSLEKQLCLAPLRLACNMGSFPQAIKEGLEILGRPVGKCADPIQMLAPQERLRLEAVLHDMKLMD